MTRRSVITGTGSALPVRCVTNAELAARVDTTDEWIVERTGIRQRHIAGQGETTATLATDAARIALDAAGLTAADIGLIVLATTTPDNTFPATATKVQAALGINDCIAFDVAAVCSGFLYALGVADSMLVTGAAKHALVIGAGGHLGQVGDGQYLAVAPELLHQPPHGLGHSTTYARVNLVKNQGLR